MLIDHEDGLERSSIKKGNMGYRRRLSTTVGMVHKMKDAILRIK